MNDIKKEIPTEADTPHCSDNVIIQRNERKGNTLREIRIKNNLSASEIVSQVRSLYPKYDKALLSKCENGEKYGITLKHRAMKMLIDNYGVIRKTENRKLNNRLTVRLSDEDYNAYKEALSESGYTTTQGFLNHIINYYIGGIV